jgi:PAT family beta-lactamase induction signal transducer AmpG
VVLEYFGYGFGFVGLMLFMMQQVAPGKYKMAHYAFATGIMNLGFMIPSMLSGYISDWLGYRHFFLWVLVATIPSFFVSFFVPFHNPEKDA